MHVPVLLKQTIEYLQIRENENFIDCTLSEGGHAKEILKRNKPKGKVLGIELDKEVFEKIKRENIERLTVVNDNYKNLKEIVKENEFNNVSGILFDLGMSSYHVDESERGFSFKKNEPLLMNYSGSGPTAREIVNQYPLKDLERIIKEYGEEKFARKIALKIIEERPMENTFQLIEAIKRAVPSYYRQGKIHFATRTFQALRIETNQELENLKQALPQAMEILEKGGRLVAISFQSLEDRIIKNFFKENKVELLTKKPVLPDEEEIRFNPRARSAKLRAVKKL
ncbi:MAG: 16S rRNA (cytosine(1402)-N(4))-methyltransferase RsmH [Candidatus Pacebacteria bacterium]|nr:16S rRNA (cytosine(1402)-N(4))-methyltransferase RsmH [Candidatus Paceibacterota bacterium]